MKEIPVIIHFPSVGSRPTRPEYRSAIWDVAQGDTRDDLDALRPPETYREARDVETRITDAPDELAPHEAQTVLQGAFDAGIPGLGFAADRGIPWRKLVELLDKAGYDPICPSLGQRPRRTLPFGLGVR